MTQFQPLSKTLPLHFHLVFPFLLLICFFYLFTYPSLCTTISTFPLLLLHLIQHLPLSETLPPHFLSLRFFFSLIYLFINLFTYPSLCIIVSTFPPLLLPVPLFLPLSKTFSSFSFITAVFSPIYPFFRLFTYPSLHKNHLNRTNFTSTFTSLYLKLFLLTFLHLCCSFLLQVRAGDNRMHRGHAGRHTHGGGAGRRAGTETVAVRRL